MDTAQWPQDTIVKPMEEIVPNNTSSCSIKAVTLERKVVRTQKEEALNCPRCNSTNTKFCYYNNYSLSQPRYFCKTCKRYWTAGGTLRNIPVGGGSRKNKRSTISTSSSSAVSLAKKNHDNDLVNPNNNNKIHNVDQAQDLNLGFSKTITQDFKNISELIKVPNFETNESSSNNNNNNSFSALELISNGISPRGGLNSFFPMPNLATDLPDAAVYNSSNGFSLLPDYFKPSLSFSLDGLIGNGGYGSLLQGVQEPSGRLFFPFEDLKQVSGATNSTHGHNINIEQNRDLQHHGDSNGFWNGVLGGGSW